MGHDFKFWGTVGAVMTALKLKDAYDDYQQLPQNEEGQRRAGPIALRSPIDDEHNTHQEDLELDTTLPTIARPKRKRHADCCCCACCGLRCGIFWKAFGAVLSLVFVWQTLRFIFWSAKPTPTGLENMPKFNSSLECKNAVYTFNPDTTTYSVPFNISRASHTVQLQGDAFGTFIITEGAQDATAIKYDLVLRSNDETLLSDVSFKYPTQEQVDDGRASSQATLDTPVSISGTDGTSCAHFDIVLYVPPQLRELTIFSSSLVHLKFASRTRSGITLDKLEISVDSPHQNLILPTTSIRANDLRLLVRKGYLVGDVSIIDSTTLETRYGDAVANVHVYPSSEEGLDDAKLTTNTGDGRADFFFMPPTPPSYSPSPSSGNGEDDENDEPHRQIASKHTASGVGDLYLKYERSGFSGRVSLKAGSATTRNMHAIDYHKSFTRGWVREEDGKDRLNIKAGRNTWVGLYF